jgi:hypothetical protein
MLFGVLDEWVACLDRGMGGYTDEAMLDSSGLVSCSTTECIELIV